MLALIADQPLACGPVACLPIPHSLVCGDAIHVGAWTPGPDTKVIIRARDLKRHRTWYKHAVQPEHFYERFLPSGQGGHCRRTRVTYTLPGLELRYTVAFKRETGTLSSSSK